MKCRDSLAGLAVVICLTVSGCKTLQSSTMAGSGSVQPVAGVESSSNSKSGGNFPPPAAAAANGKPTGPPPRVADCRIINQGSPNKFVCNGKTYTSFDLYRARIAWEKKQAAGL